MKKTFFITFGLLILFSFYVGAKHFWRGEILSLDKVCSRWSESIFLLEKFKVADPTNRSKMTCSLIKQKKKFVGKDLSEIRNDFGDHDGFYFSDMFPAYMLKLAIARHLCMS